MKKIHESEEEFNKRMEDMNLFQFLKMKVYHTKGYKKMYADGYEDAIHDFMDKLKEIESMFPNPEWKRYRTMVYDADHNRKEVFYGEGFKKDVMDWKNKVFGEPR